MTFDSDILIWYLRGNEEARAFVARVPFDRRVIPAMVYFELLQGCAGARDVHTVRRFVVRNFSRLLHISEQVSHRAASLLERFAVSHGLEAADALIAATAQVNRLKLATGNAAHFRHLPGLNVVVFRPK